MNTYKTFSGWLQIVALAVVSFTFAASANALTLGQLIGAVIPPQPQAELPATNGLASGLTPSRAPARQVEPGLWKSKAEFLAAARNGDLIAIDKVLFGGGKESVPIVVSIASILQTDYGVIMPFVEYNPEEMGHGNDRCMYIFDSKVDYVLKTVTKMHALTLSNKAPDFYKAPSDQSIKDVELMVQNMQRGGDFCDPEVLGVWKPHPYKAALLKLMDEYGQATKDYIEAERSSRKAAYVNAQTQQQAAQKARDDAQAKQASDARIAEQQRIEAEEKQRVERNKKRIGG